MALKTRVSGVRLQKKFWNHANPSGSTGTVVYNWTDWTDGGTLPYWQAYIRNGVDATTGFAGRRTTFERSEGYIEWQGALTGIPSQRRLYGESGDIFQGNLTASSPSGAYLNKAMSIASSKFWNETADSIKAIEGLECIAETHKTAGSIVRRSVQMAKLLLNWRRNLNQALSSARRGNRATSARRAMGAVSGAYLEWKFGYDPLAKDMRALASELKNDFVEFVQVSARGKHSGPGSINTEEITGLPVMEYKNIFKSVEECSVRFEAGIKVTRYGVGGLVERLGMSPSNFVPTLYNLLPWTYMLDYFSNVGDIISGISFDPGRITWCNRSIRHSLKVECLAGVSPSFNKAVYTADPGYPICIPSKQTVITTTFTRSKDRPDRVPSLVLKMPNTYTEGGRKQALNIAAVLASKTWGNSRIAAYGR